MIFTAVFILAALGIMIFPMIIPFMLITYMAFDGIASRHLMSNLKVTLGGVNVYLPDLLYASAAILAVLGILRVLASGKMRQFVPATRMTIYFVIFYFIFFMGKLINGYFEGAPVDSLIRRFASDTQCVYMFLPLFYLKQEYILKRLLYFIVVVTLLFPLAQPFLYGTADQVALQAGQGGTLRLGSGNANVMLMLGVMAFFVWERKIWLSALPMAGIAMLAMRSAFISLALSILVLSIQKKKSAKFISLMVVACALLIATLVIIQATSSVPVIDKAAERLSQTFEKTGSTMARVAVIPAALAETGNRPVLGYSYHEIHELKKKQHRDASAFNMLHPHNFVLSSLLRTGVLGTLCLFVIIGLVMLSARRLIRNTAVREQGMYLFATVLFFVVFGLMNTSFFSAGFVFWILAGTCLWYTNETYKNREQKPRKALI